MALNKRRGRKPKKATVAERDRLKRKKHWLDCDECGLEGAEVDGDVERFTCGRCVQKMVVPPVFKKPVSPEEKALRQARKLERAKQREAKKAGITLDTKDLGFGRGWHRKALFTTEVDGKPRYFSFGKEITKKEYTKLAKAREKADAKKAAGTSGWGRGWHLKGEFVAPTGDLYESGTLLKKAEVEPDEAELLALMMQHTEIVEDE
jgi:hypothetical protein